MPTSNSSNLGLLEGRKFIIGREGHIYISDPAASKQHAELEIVDGRILIRDLDSTNGIYFIRDDRPVRFSEEFVEPEQVIVIGQQRHRITQLLAILGDLSE